MIYDDLDTSWKQHFPTYTFNERDIAIEEYKISAKSLESEERIFINATNIAIISAAGLGSLAVGSLDKLVKTFEETLPPLLILIILLLLTVGFSIITIQYFADRQKSIVFSVRKIIVLRRMLGLNYGNVQLVLPNWRIEGADEPFAIRLFPGWRTYVTYPFYSLTGISSTVIFFLTAFIGEKASIPKAIFNFPAWGIFILLTILWVIFLLHTYRKALFDTHETTFLLVITNIASFIRLKLVRNIEYIIYRATLARFELSRMKVNLSNLKTILVFIEDKRFYKHKGVDVFSLIRAFLGLIKVRRRSGGSTITQQLARTLFIQDLSKVIRRKLIELPLALWFNENFSKEDQLNIYLASVRFEKGIYGVVEAMKYFWGEVREAPTMAESFFLVERVSNIQSRLLTSRIIQISKEALRKNILTIDDIINLLELYRNAISEGKIIDENGGIEKLIGAFKKSQPRNPADIKGRVID